MNPSMFLAAYEQGWLRDNRALLGPMVRGSLAVREVLQFCSNQRRAAIAALLQTGSSATYARRLQRSGSAFAWFLQQRPDVDVLASECTPLFDALAVDDVATAEAIARAAPATRRPEEYEEDFLFASFAMQVVLGKQREGLAMLAPWERCLQGSADLRLDVCKALAARAAADFRASSTAWLDELRQRYRERADTTDPTELATEAYVSIVGIAMLRLGRRFGLDDGTDLPMVPGLATGNLGDGWASQSFRTSD